MTSGLVYVTDQDPGITRKRRGRGFSYTAPDGTTIAGWSDIPGAKGCTPQSCAFRDHHADLLAAGADRVYGLSVQSTPDQQEAAERLHLPFALLSDQDLKLQRALGLPLLQAAGLTLLHRITFIIKDGVIAHVFHSITDTALNATDVLRRLEAQNK